VTQNGIVKKNDCDFYLRHCHFDSHRADAYTKYWWEEIL